MLPVINSWTDCSSNYWLLQERQPEIGGALSCQRMLAFLFFYIFTRLFVILLCSVCDFGILHMVSL